MPKQNRTHHDTARPRSRSQTASERGKNFLVLTLCLAIAAGASLLNLGMMLSEPGVEASISGPADRNATLVREFYAAVDDAIRTGVTGSIDRIVAPDLTWCGSCSGQSLTREGFKRYLESLHRAAPNMRVEVESVVAGFAGNVTARIRVSGQPMLSELIPWGPVDMFRIDGGVISERRNGANDIEVVEPRIGTRFDSLPPAATGVVLARLTFPEHSGVEGLLSPGPTLLVVESGEIAVHVAHAGRMVRAGDVETPLETDALLRQGDAAIIPPGVRHAFRQVGTEPALAVGMTLYFSDDWINDSAPRGPSMTPFLTPEGSISTSTSPPPMVQILGSGTMGAWPSGPVRVALGWAILGPGARLVPSVTESILLAVEGGTLTISGEKDRTILAGSSVVQPAGMAREFRNDGYGLTVLHVLTIAPVAD
jgi:quercetin dioxygenase-like cupin family protein